MPSLHSRLFVFALKHSHWLRLQPKRTSTITWDTSIPQLRLETDRSAARLGRLPDDVTVTPAAINDVYAEWVQPAAAAPDKALLYFHGGGYVLGSARAHRGVVAKFAKGAAIAALVVDYRLAPEHPYPAAVEDALAAYRWLLAQGIQPSHIALMGDSAGGGLALATLLALRDQGIPLPAAAVALSPWTDLKNTGESLQTNAEVDTLSWVGSWTIFSKYYAGDQDPGQSWISPLYGDLAGLPPLLIYTGSDETLRDDATRFAAKAQAAGVDVTLHVGEGLFHCYPACAPLFPEARQAMAEICAFLQAHVGVAQPAYSTTRT